MLSASPYPNPPMKHLFTTLLLALCLWLPAATYGQSLVSISPNNTGTDPYGSATQHVITGTGTNFTNTSVLWVSLNLHNLYYYFGKPNLASEMHTGVAWQIQSPTSIQVTVALPNYWWYGFYPGTYDVEVMTTTGLLKLDSAFHVTNSTLTDEAYLTPDEIKVYPTVGTPGQTLDVVVTGHGALFDQGSTVLHFDFDQAINSQVVNSFTRINDTLVLANITISPATPLGKYDLTVQTRQSGVPVLNNVFRVVSSLPAAAPGSIQGIVYKDDNRNCMKEGGEMLRARQVVKAEPGPYFAVTNGSGAYNLRVPYGTYTVRQIHEQFREAPCNLSNQTVSAGTPTLTGRNLSDARIVCNTTLEIIDTSQNPQYYCNAWDLVLKHKGYVGNEGHIRLQIYGHYYDSNIPEWYTPCCGYSEQLTDSTRIYTALRKGQYRFIGLNGSCTDTLYFNLGPEPVAVCDPYVNILSITNANGCDQGSVTFEHRGTISDCIGAYTYLFQKNTAQGYRLAYIFYNGEHVSTRTFPLSPSEYMLVNFCNEGGAQDTAKFTIGGAQSPYTLVASNASTPSQYRIQWSITNQCPNEGTNGSITNLTTGERFDIFNQSTVNTVDVQTPGTYLVAVISYTGVERKQLVEVTAYTWPLTFGAANDDYVKGLVRDSKGDMYVSLSFRGTINLAGTTLTSTSATRRDMAIAKFHKSGYLLWVRKMGNGTFDMEPQGVNIDGAGNPYWAGSFAGSINFSTGNPGGIGLTAAGSYDAFTARFDPASGHCVWARRVGSTGNDYLYACFVSNSGNVYAGGSYGAAFSFPITGGATAMPNAGGLDGFIVKFDPSGNGIWASRVSSSSDDEVKSIAYNGGDLVASGYMGNACYFQDNVTFSTNSASRDGWAGRINSLGQYVWVKPFGTIFNDEATAVCMDPSTGNVFVAAQVADAPLVFNSVSHSGFGGNDIAVLGWNFYTQAPVWAKRVGSASGDTPYQINWDGTRLVVAGQAGGSINTGSGGIGTLAGKGGQDAVVIRYNKSTGNVTSGELFGSPGNDRAYTLWTNTATREAAVGGVFSGSATFPSVAGPRASNGLLDGFVTLLPAPGPSARMEMDEDGLAAKSSLKAYPVPFTNQLTIETEQSVELLDLQGRRMATAQSENGQAVLKVSSLKTGIYLVRTADGQVARVVKE